MTKQKEQINTKQDKSKARQTSKTKQKTHPKSKKVKQIKV